jgi:hypothetical protein
LNRQSSSAANSSSVSMICNRSARLTFAMMLSPSGIGVARQTCSKPSLQPYMWKSPKPSMPLKAFFTHFLGNAKGYDSSKS